MLAHSIDRNGIFTMFLTLLSAATLVISFACGYIGLFFYDHISWALVAASVLFFLIDRYCIPDKQHPSMQDSTIEPDYQRVSTIDQVPFEMPISEDTPINSLAKPNFKGDLVLFFDIDGVLHPNQTESLELKDKLLTLIDAYPNIELIMCSDWRVSSPLEWFEKRFGPALSVHFMGCTPVLDSKQEFRRQREVETFVNHFNVRRFLVVDDRQDFYEPGFSNLVVTDTHTGLTEKNLSDISNLISQYQ